LLLCDVDLVLLITPYAYYLGMFDLLWLIFKRKSVVRITTGSQVLDDLLGGNISLDPFLTSHASAIALV
jgi:hypothetical protein